MSSALFRGLPYELLVWHASALGRVFASDSRRPEEISAEFS
jgi:hypothetical protein